MLTVTVIALTLALVAPATAVPDGGDFGPEIDDYANYEGQSDCLNVEQPGVQAFRDMVMDVYPETGRGSILRDCNSGGRSEHKEGRAWDWMVNADVTSEKRAAEEVLDWLLATDEHGNKHAMARRLGVMYIIWDRQVWNAYRPEQGWRPYTGAHPHTDHVHFSFSWDGALAQTSFYTTDAVAGLQPPPPQFSDVSNGSMYAEPVQWLAQSGITRGANDDEFRPAASVSRQQMASFLWRKMGEPDAPAANFPDVRSGNSHRAAIDWLADNEITRGDADGNFNPNAPVTRAQMASFLWRTVNEPDATSTHSFTDVPSAHDPAVSWLSEAGITTGVDEHTYDSRNRVTRGQMALFLHRKAGSEAAWSVADPISPYVRF